MELRFFLCFKNKTSTVFTVFLHTARAGWRPRSIGERVNHGSLTEAAGV